MADSLPSRLAFFIHYYEPIFARSQERLHMVRAQTLNLAAMDLAAFSILLASVLFLLQAGTPPTGSTLTVALLAAALFALSVALSISVLWPRGFAEAEFSDESFDRLRVLDLVSLMEHRLYWLRENIKFNHAVYQILRRRHTLALVSFSSSTIILILYGLLKTFTRGVS